MQLINWVKHRFGPISQFQTQSSSSSSIIKACSCWHRTILRIHVSSFRLAKNQVSKEKRKSILRPIKYLGLVYWTVEWRVFQWARQMISRSMHRELKFWFLVAIEAIYSNLRKRRESKTGRKLERPDWHRMWLMCFRFSHRWSSLCRMKAILTSLTWPACSRLSTLLSLET